MSGPRPWLVRAPVLAWLGWLLIRYWDDRSYLSIWHGINLAIHEAGHVLFSALGWLPGVAGGTILELLVPLIAGGMLYRQGDRFGVAVVVCWLGIVCFETATYAGDALALALPLVSPFGDPGAAGHDWANILSRYGALRHTHAVAAAWEWAGRVLMITGLALGAGVLWRTLRAHTEEERREASAAPADGMTGGGVIRPRGVASE